ncbi:TetR/AcrR family transcriptional regulator [Burkholderia sp. Ac-20384]|uniref:TetR family transcriptional regulator n=1 Tax=Burkholderia sp. Ac-20384 TaxID=2703902 RepID=UPI0019814806|nr:TetR/AcrR family transcriptional regulator [Burkholderia sp. Ac-20384]
MKVSRTQSVKNRSHIVETASVLFRERGYDGVGVAELMAAAGFTHGGFYRHFQSKGDLMTEAVTCGIAQTVAASDGLDIAGFVQRYVSREHRDGRSTGCTMAALSGDAARQPAAVKAAFADGIESAVAAILEHDGVVGVGAADQPEARAKIVDTLAHLVGAIVLSRACPDDSPLADEILAASRNAILASLAPADTR